MRLISVVALALVFVPLGHGADPAISFFGDRVKHDQDDFVAQSQLLLSGNLKAGFHN